MAVGKNSSGIIVSEQELVITRVFDAPRALVFEAWTRPEQLMQWWAPQGCTALHCKVDLRIGGLFHYCIRVPEGQEIWGRGIYREIVVPERIVYTDSFSDAQGNLVSPIRYGADPEYPTESLVTVTFVEQGGRTTLTLRHAIPEAVKERQSIDQGWNDMLGRLAIHLPNS